MSCRVFTLGDMVGSLDSSRSTSTTELSADKMRIGPRPLRVIKPKHVDAVRARRDGITDAGLAHFQSAYPGEKITKEDLFYYVYGILHSPDYRERYADNLGKELPRIPRVRKAEDFWAFSRAGRTLGDLHVGYERVPEYTTG